MPYVSLDNLARFHGRMQDWASSEFASLDMANWQKTAAAGAVSFSPVPEMPLDPAVNFLFAESGPASGTKGPDNPSTITGVTQAKVTRCGKNLCPPFEPGSRYGITCTNNGDGSFTVSGIATHDVGFSFPMSITLHPGTYTLSGCPAGGSLSTYYLAGTGGRRDVGNGETFTAVAVQRFFVWFQILSGTDFSTPVIVRPQLELGSTATSFEPYEGADYTIDLNGTYYGGSVDLSAGTMTVTWWGEYVSTITNTELAPTYVRTTLAVTYGHMGSSTAPTYFRSNYDDNGTYVYPRYSAGTARISISLPYEMLGLDPSTATEQTAKSAVGSFLAQHPCFVVYKLYTPQTISLAPTQIYSLSQPDPYTPRINTVYSDQVSVQAGYPKSPQATATELTNAIVSLGSNL